MSKVEAYQKQFSYYRSLAEKSISQIEDALLFEIPSAESNSIAIIMKHMSGNMLSRWTDIFESDGEKSWRDRDDEFVNTFDNRDELITYWDKGWERVEDTLDDIHDDDLETTIYIRNMGCTLHDAIIRQLSHYSYHIGQIVFIARMLKKEGFTSLSIPKGKSKEYNQKRFSKEKEMKHFTDDLDEN